MLTKEEKAFVDYWRVQRERPKKYVTRLSSGLPLGVGIVALLFISIITGWNKQAMPVLRSHSSLIITVVIAALVIVVFLSVFSANHEWDQFEERYQVLLQKEVHEAATGE